MSNWDRSQLDIGIDPIGIDPNVQLGSIPIRHWDQSQKDFFVTAGTDLLLNNFVETEVSLFSV